MRCRQGRNPKPAHWVACTLLLRLFLDFSTGHQAAMVQCAPNAALTGGPVGHGSGPLPALQKTNKLTTSHFNGHWPALVFPFFSQRAKGFNYLKLKANASR